MFTESQVKEYLSGYSGLNRFYRAESIGQREPKLRKAALDFCIEKEMSSKIVFKVEEAMKEAHHIVEGRSSLTRGQICQLEVRVRRADQPVKAGCEQRNESVRQACHHQGLDGAG